MRFWSGALVVCALFARAPLASAQPASSSPSAAVAADSAQGSPRLRLHVTCTDANLDYDYLKRELSWVDWVRDRADADVRVLLTLRGTGSGGEEGTFYVTRPHGGGPAADTLRVFASATDSEDAKRQLIARTLRALLARDLAERPEGPRLNVQLGAPPSSAPPAAATRDPWDHWVYKLGTNGYVDGEQSYSSAYLRSSLTASRVTERHKMGASLSQNYNDSHYEFEDGSTYSTFRRSWNGRGLFTRALSPRWSAGTSLSVSSSSWSNIHLSYGVGPAVEFDVFPYLESSSRSLTLGYQLYVSHTKYEELTLYGKTAETLLRDEFDATLSLRKSWGSLDLAGSYSHYLHDASKYRLTSYVNTNLKLWRGFSLEGDFWAARTRDQLALRRGDASDTEVITRQHQLATGYQYNGSFGISYRFGSIFDNVVNQRLENTLGGL